jgi:hypothetical protein
MMRAPSSAGWPIVGARVGVGVGVGVGASVAASVAASAGVDVGVGARLELPAQPARSGCAIRGTLPPRLCCSRATLFCWRTHLEDDGLAGLVDPSRGRPPYKPSAARMSGNERSKSRCQYFGW